MFNFFGIDNVPHFVGVVEDVDDPLKLGRVRVRIHGVHTENKTEDDNTGEGIPTEHLPWAHPLQPITSAGVSGIGQSPTGIVRGSWVVGISRDGELFNDLIVLGTIAGSPSNAPNPNVGFNDPNGEYPRYTGESDVNRLARNENIDKTIISGKKSGVEKNVSTGEGTWNEPQTPYAAQYPFNHVHESESGHVHEVDDTPDAERLHEYHKSGTFEEIHPDGTKVTKIVADNYEIVLHDNNCLVKGELNITVNENANVYVKENANIKVDGNLSYTVGGNMSQTVKGTISITCDGYTLDGGSSAKLTASRIDIN